MDLAPVAHPEVPARIDLVERRVAHDDDRLVLGPVGQRGGQPLHLRLAEPRPGAGLGAVQGLHVAHPLLRGHALGGPVVGRMADRVQADDAHPLVVEHPRRLAEVPVPGLSHVQVPVVLARNEVLLDRGDLRQHLHAELQLHGVALLRQIAAEDHEVEGRALLLDLLEGPARLLDEARVQRLRVEVGVGNPGEAERAGRRVGDVDGGEGLEESRPGDGAAGQQGVVKEGPA